MSKHREGELRSNTRSNDSESANSDPFRRFLRILSRFARQLVLGFLALAVLGALAWYSEAYYQLRAFQNERATGLASVAGPLLARQVSVDLAKVQAAPAPDRFLIVKTAALSVIAQDFDGARGQIERITSDQGGYIAEINSRTVEGTSRELHAALRIPAAHFDAALRALRQLGRVEEESQTSQEVSEESADIDASLRNTRVTEQRLLDLLRTRTAKLEDIVAAEKEVAQTRTEIEKLQRRRASLDRRIQFSSIDLQIHEQSAERAVSAGARLRGSVASSFRMLGHSLLEALVWVVEFGPTLFVWLLILFWPVRYLWRLVRTATNRPASERISQRT